LERITSPAAPRTRNVVAAVATPASISLVRAGPLKRSAPRAAVMPEGEDAGLRAEQPAHDQQEASDDEEGDTRHPGLSKEVGRLESPFR
jgi:hypothetical protein